MPALRNLLSGLGFTALVASMFFSPAVLPVEVTPLLAQETTGENASAPEEAPLSTKQDALAIQYDRFEKTLRELSEYMKTSDPGRADLLIRAFGQSKKDQVALQMHELVRLLDQEQLGDALERQEQLVEQLHGLLGLLQSEDRRSEIEDEQERLQELLKDVNKLIAQQKGVRARTERGEDMQSLSDKQNKVTENADGLLQKIKAQDAEKNQKSSDGQDSSESEEQSSEGEGSESPNQEGETKKDDGEKADGENKEGDDSEQEPADESEKKNQDAEKDSNKDDSDSSKGESESSQDGKGKPGDKNKPQEGQPSESESSPSDSESEPSEGQQSQGQQSQGQQSQGQQSQGQQSQQQQQTPGREELEQARKEMEQAIKELEKQARDEASGRQDEAIRKLAEAKAKLEEILRQLREEERELALQDLEARFQRMLALQTAVYTGTVALNKNASEENKTRHHTRSVKLARDEDAIILEAEKALALLREEGTSIAFPEAVEQIRDDMSLVSRRLSRAQTDDQTVLYEEDIIAALKEMIEALQKEIEKAKEQRQQPPSNQQMQPQDNSLVEKIAELKMLRSLQLRINRRTKTLGELNEEEQASDPDIIDQLKQLSRRQARLQQATHDIVTGKNK